MKLVAIVGSAVQSGKTRQAVELAVRAAQDFEPGLEVDIIDLGFERVSILDGRPSEQYVDQTIDVIDRIKSGTMFLLASPIYRGTYTGALKNLLDHLPVDALEGKAVGFIATGATMHHYLAIDQQFRSLLAWFNSFLLPGSVYLDNSAYTNGQLVCEKSLASLRQLGEALVILSSKLDGVSAYPPSLTRQMMTARAR